MHADVEIGVSSASPGAASVPAVAAAIVPVATPVTPARLAWTITFAAMFFLGSADSVFATRVGGMNLRWGQLLLLGAGLVLSREGLRRARDEWRDRPDFRAIAIAWAAFFGLYALSSVLSAAPTLSLVKLGWAVFNIGGAALLCLVGGPRDALRRGFIAGCVVIAAVIWVDAIALHWLARDPLLGLAQDSYVYDGVLQRRPHAFFYEPSYAGATLAFALPILLLITGKMRRIVRLGAPAVVLSSIVLTSARTGMLSLVAGFLVMLVLGVRPNAREVLRRLASVAAVVTLLLVVFFAATPRSRIYGAFIAGPLGPFAVLQRVFGSGPPKVDGTTSEGARASNFREGFAHWQEHPILGAGVVPGGGAVPVGGRLLQPQTTDTWLEVALESGLLGLLALAAAMALSVRAALRRTLDAPSRIFLLAAIAAHVVVNLNLTQTFPRLDYWLVFFAALRLVVPPREPAGNQAVGATPAR